MGINFIDNPPDPGRIIEGLRDTGYDFNTAIADIVDNSIAANANDIRITVSMDAANKPVVYIADNGCGMDADGLMNAMRYGSKERPDPESLGKFGLGLKTASTAFCRKLSLISVGSDGIMRKVQWDLDYVADHGWVMKSLDPNDDEHEILDEIRNGKTGTLVVWENIDRLFRDQDLSGARASNALKKATDSLSFHLRLVFQRFLDRTFSNVKNVNIYLNDEKLKAWDPFCRYEPQTDVVGKQTYNVSMPGGTVAPLHLTAYAIPVSGAYSSEEAEKSARISTDYMGFYIYRENRLIHYGDWLNMFVKDPHESLLRVDFSFDHRLDEAFSVDIKKSRVLLNSSIYEVIRTQFINAPKRAANAKYRSGSQKIIAKKSKGAHDAADRNIDSKAPALENAKVRVTNAETGEVEIQNRNGTFSHTITVTPVETPTERRIVPVDDLPDGVLWEPAVIGGKIGVRINTSHPFYQKIYYPVLNENIQITGMDALMWSLAAIELETMNDEEKEMYEDIRVQVSRKLKKLLADIPDPDLRGDE